jgi:hypothetical protein
MSQAQTFTDFDVKPFDKMNGANTSYFIEFSSGVPTYDNDQFYIKFPDACRTPKSPVCKTIIGGCINTVECNTETGKVVATFTSIPANCQTENAKFRFWIEGIVNPTTSIKSERF